MEPTYTNLTQIDARITDLECEISIVLEDVEMNRHLRVNAISPERQMHFNTAYVAAKSQMDTLRNQLDELRSARPELKQRIEKMRKRRSELEFLRESGGTRETSTKNGMYYVETRTSEELKAATEEKNKKKRERSYAQLAQMGELVHQFKGKV